MADLLSDETWRRAWAKAPIPVPGERREWLPLHTHLTDTGAVIRIIWDEWAGPGIRGVIAADTGGDHAVAQEIVALAGAWHDIGKCTPAFAGQERSMREEMERHGFRWRGIEQTDSKSLPHGRSGHVIVSEHLQSLGVPVLNAEAFAVVVGGHHGVPPSTGELNDARINRRFFGGKEWERARDALLREVVARLGLDDALESLRTVQLSDASQLLVQGLVIMADWIASNETLFPGFPHSRMSR